MDFATVIVLSVWLFAVAKSDVGFVSRGFRFDFDSGASTSEFTPILSSSSGAFAVGFLKNGGDRSIALAIAGLDEKSKLLDTVWVGNRDDPIAGATSISLVFDGNLYISKNAGGEILHNIFNGSSSISPPEVLELEDSGNLQLRSNSSASIFWQSFDHPGDTLLQGQNFTHEMMLVSSQSPKNPKSGPYSLQLGDDRMILYNAPDASLPGEPYWENAALQEPSQIDSSKGFMYVTIGDGFLGMYQGGRKVQFTPFISQNADARLPNGTIRRGRVDPDGNFRVYYWVNGHKVVDYTAMKGPCSSPVACGMYGVCNVDHNGSCSCPVAAFEGSPFTSRNPSQGCALRNAPVLCGGGGTADVFVQVNGMDYVATKYLDPKVTSIDQCRAGCLSSCTCKAFFFRNDSSTCFHTSQLQSLLKSSNPKDIAYIRVGNPLALDTHGTSSSYGRRVVGIIMLVLAAAFAISSTVFGLVCYSRHRKFMRSGSWHSDEEGFLRSNSNKFTYSELETATNGFKTGQDAKNVGEFSGTLANNERIIVLRFNKMSKREFQLRVRLTEKLGHEHPNVAIPCGYCIHSEASFFLVFEQQGSTLEQQLQQERDWGRPLLDDNSKMNLALGIAKGLEFVHSNGMCFHQGNIMPGTILVDEEAEDRLEARLCGLVQISASGSGTSVENRNVGQDEEVRCFGRIILQLLSTFSSGTSTNSDVQVDTRQSRFVQVGKTCCCDHQGPPSMSSVISMLEGARTPMCLEV